MQRAGAAGIDYVLKCSHILTSSMCGAIGVTSARYLFDARSISEGGATDGGAARGPGLSAQGAFAVETAAPGAALSRSQRRGRTICHSRLAWRLPVADPIAPEKAQEGLQALYRQRLSAPPCKCSARPSALSPCTRPRRSRMEQVSAVPQ